MTDDEFLAETKVHEQFVYVFPDGLKVATHAIWPTPPHAKLLTRQVVTTFGEWVDVPE